MLLNYLYNFPAATNGLALANIGMGVMIYGLCARLNHILDDGILGLVSAFILAGVAMLVIYFAKIAANPKKWYAEDSNTSTPIKLAMIGALAMATCLLGKALSIPQYKFPIEFPFAIVIIGGVIQLYAMILFLYSCYSTSTWPEPFWNNAVHSAVFPAVCLPGNSLTAYTIRSFFLCIGLVFLVPDVAIMSFRVLAPRKSPEDVVTNNPTVAVLQAACSITCTGWFSSPLTKDAVTGIGGAIGHTLFALSTMGWVFSMIGIWQRREKLLKFGDHPMWVGFTFPFANTAICACVYRVAHPELHYALTVWVYVLSAVATLCIMYVNWMFVRNFFFVFGVPAAAPPPPLLPVTSEKKLEMNPSNVTIADLADDCVGDHCEGYEGKDETTVALSGGMEMKNLPVSG